MRDFLIKTQQEALKVPAGLKSTKSIHLIIMSSNIGTDYVLVSDHVITSLKFDARSESQALLAGCFPRFVIGDKKILAPEKVRCNGLMNCGL